jgi:hypothetical protein
VDSPDEYVGLGCNLGAEVLWTIFVLLGDSTYLFMYCTSDYKQSIRSALHTDAAGRQNMGLPIIVHLKKVVKFSMRICFCTQEYACFVWGIA